MQKAKRFFDGIRSKSLMLKSRFLLPLKVLFSGSREYWESRYATGGTSGPGSCREWAEFKAQVVNSFVKEHHVSSVIEFGCGDGNQLSLARYPTYIGLDVSKTAIELCKARFKNDPAKTFFLYDPDHFGDVHGTFTAELALSLDVIYHLIEDRIFELYVKHLFSAAQRFVIVYSSDTDVNPLCRAPHIKHRRFSEWINRNLPEWKLVRKMPNKYRVEGCNRKTPCADFFIYEKPSANPDCLHGWELIAERPLRQIGAVTRSSTDNVAIPQG
jgi:hypothetical protein